MQRNATLYRRNEILGLYIHIPFCLSKCPYCDFYSIEYNQDTAKLYRDAVIRNIKALEETYDTVYFGGGTPILLWREIVDILQFVNTAGKYEITVEANPCCTTEEALYKLKNAGASRVSFGVQSLNGSELSLLGRRHTAEQAEKAVLLAKKCGFDNISADIMLGTPSQNIKSIKDTINKLCALPLTHISAYVLKIEHNTPFASQKLDLPDEDTVCEVYLEASELLEKNGFSQYEISNFSKKGFECRHNLKYWRCEEYVGIGPASHSFYKGKRFFVERSCADFIESQLQKTIIEDKSPRTFDEYAMLKLRLCEGLSFEDCAAFGIDKDIIQNRLKHIPEKLYITEKDRVALTREGFLLSNSVIGAILGY